MPNSTDIRRNARETFEDDRILNLYDEEIDQNIKIHVVSFNEQLEVAENLPKTPILEDVYNLRIFVIRRAKSGFYAHPVVSRNPTWQIFRWKQFNFPLYLSMVPRESLDVFKMHL